MIPATRILIVDDEPLILSMMERILIANGYDVITTANSDEAIRFARSQHFDLFMVDLIMPGRDGIETMLSIRAQGIKTPIIAMSGGWNGGANSCLPLARKLGACETLAKPFDLAALLAAVQNVVEKRQNLAV